MRTHQEFRALMKAINIDPMRSLIDIDERQKYKLRLSVVFSRLQLTEIRDLSDDTITDMVLVANVA